MFSVGDKIIVGKYSRQSIKKTHTKKLNNNNKTKTLIVAEMVRSGEHERSSGVIMTWLTQMSVSGG